MFQFLIGTLKTAGFIVLDHVPEPFQFLIGTLKTSSDTVPPCFLSQFQFLIGTLKTDYLLQNDLAKRRVSIPHRHSKNPLNNHIQLFKYDLVINNIKII